MDNLYNIFQREKERVGDEFTVFYNKQKNSMQYKNDEGALTVLFNEKEGSERFFFKSADEQEKGLGMLVQQTTDHGQNGYLQECIFELPQNFINLTQSYQYQRAEIGVEKPVEKPKHKSYER